MPKTPAQLDAEIAEALAPQRRGAFKIPSTDPRSMSAAQINKELDRLSVEDSKLGDQMIAAGRGYERPSEYLRMEDPLSRALRVISERRMRLHIEIELRYGPGAPSRLPSGRGFGPRKEYR